MIELVSSKKEFVSATLRKSGQIKIKNGFLPASRREINRLRVLKDLIEAYKEHHILSMMHVVAFWTEGSCFEVGGKRTLRIPLEIAREALGREIRHGERLNYSETKKVLDHLYYEWTEGRVAKLISELEKRLGEGLIWERERRERIKYSPNFLPFGPTDIEGLKRFREILKAIETTGLEEKFSYYCNFSYVDAYGMEMDVTDRAIYFSADRFLREAVFPDREETCFRELRKCVEYLYERWTEGATGELIRRALERGLVHPFSSVNRPAFVWSEHEVKLGGNVLPFGPGEVKEAEMLKAFLEIVEETGTEGEFKYKNWKFLEEIRVERGKIFVPAPLFRQALGRDPGELPSLSDVKSAAEYLYERWTKGRTGELIRRALEEKIYDRSLKFPWSKMFGVTGAEILKERTRGAKETVKLLRRFLDLLEDLGLQDLFKYRVSAQEYFGGPESFSEYFEIPESVGKEMLGKERLEPLSFSEVKEVIRGLYEEYFRVPFSFFLSCPQGVEGEVSPGGCGRYLFGGSPKGAPF